MTGRPRLSGAGWVALVTGMLAWATGCPSDRDPPDDDDAVGPGDDDSASGDDDDDTSSDDDDDSAAAIPVNDVFEQTADPVDILFVVDNSCSMQEEQDALVLNFSSLFQHLGGVDFHIGVTVADDWATQPPIGVLYGSTRYIDPSTPNPPAAFLGNMTMGSDGMGSCEVGLESSYLALTEPLISGYNGGFYRDEARLTIVVVSDEVDGSTVGCAGIDAYGYANWLTTLKAGGQEWVHFGAIVGDRPSGCTSNWGAADTGRGYLEVVDALAPDQGTFQSICDHDWSMVMSDLGQVSVSVQLVFPLSEAPVPGSIRAFLDFDGYGPDPEIEIFEDASYTLDYSFIYDDVTRSLVFVRATTPPLGSLLRVTYQAEPTP